MLRGDTGTDVDAADAERLVCERALAILAQQVCEYTGSPVDMPSGHCGDANRVDATHTHCPFCGSGDECRHLFAQQGDDSGYSGPDIPLVPDDWSVPEDWSGQQLQDVLGDLRPAFDCYEELPDLNEDFVQFEVFWELTALMGSDVRRVEWCGDGMAAGIGSVVYAADPRSATAELAGLIDRLQAAILRLEPLRRASLAAEAEANT